MKASQNKNLFIEHVKFLEQYVAYETVGDAGKMRLYPDETFETVTELVDRLRIDGLIECPIGTA